MRKSSIIEIPPADIDPDPGQPRKEFPNEELLGLARTMARRQIEPIHVRRNGGRYRLVRGQRRWMAAKLAGLPSVTAIVLEEPTDEATEFEEQVLSDTQRAALNPIETAAAIQRLMNLRGAPAGAIAARLDMSAGQASKLLTLLLLPSEVQQCVAQRKLAASTAYAIAKVGDPVERDRLAREAIGGRLTRDSAAAQSRAVNAGRAKRPTAPRRRPPRVVIPLGQDRSVAVTAPDVTLASIVNLVNDAAHLVTSAQTAGLAVADLIKRVSRK